MTLKTAEKLLEEKQLFTVPTTFYPNLATDLDGPPLFLKTAPQDHDKRAPP